jgi:hypothetical protein
MRRLVERDFSKLPAPPSGGTVCALQDSVMYMRDALRLCAALHQRAAQVYLRVGALAVAASLTGEHWESLAEESQASARMLLALMDLTPDDGPFLTELPSKIAAAVRSIEPIASGIDRAETAATAIDFGYTLEQLRLPTLTRELVAACRSWGHASARLLEMAAAACEPLPSRAA